MNEAGERNSPGNVYLFSKDHGGFDVFVHDGDFSYWLPPGVSPHAPRYQEMKMKTNVSSVSQSRAKPASRRGRNTMSSDSPANAFDCPREQMIAEAAYFRAERRGFEPGSEISDWLEAEADVEHLLNGRGGLPEGSPV